MCVIRLKVSCLDYREMSLVTRLGTQTLLI